ncbi:MAG TPA: undecaprenyl-phosphate glucose phosphotransferase [bacterium]|jgi:exopolysaccharide biosynthesis polyprenyl glycosylphosphotransferase|nr:undecaprenyl-phosphate glucose phosphotransferase [bacterium]
MPKPIEKLLLAVTDLITINLAFFGLLQLRTQAHLFVAAEPGILLRISLLIYLVWMFLFIFFGLYQSWYTKSRFDELITVLKTVAFGIALIFIATFEPETDFSRPPTIGRMMIVSYFALMLIFVGGGRLLLHTVQRKLLEAGIGQRNTLIIGWNNNARKLAGKIRQFPALGYRVVGFVSLEDDHRGEKHEQVPVLGELKNLQHLVTKHRVEEVILSLGRLPQKKVLQVISQLEELPVQIKIEPDLYGIVMGQARTQQIYGFPLIEIQPQLLSSWERKTKRIIDIAVSLVSLVILSPLFLITAIAIKLTSAGPIFYKQKRVGKNGRIFTIYKFRTMVRNAEKLTGPVWAGEKDPRVTPVGRFLRKTRIDEFPQLLNVLDGDMSLVGPRPERPYFVDRLKREYPFYTRRLKVQPGITGWAQVKGEYDTTIEGVKEKLEYDLYYIENMSLRMDFRIIFYTLATILRFKGQ